MNTIFSWIKGCFNYLVFGQHKEQLVVKISDNKELKPEIQDKLKQSIISGGPQETLKILDDHQNEINPNLRQELINDIMRASQMYANPIEQCQAPVNNPASDSSSDSSSSPKTKRPVSTVKSETKTIREYKPDPLRQQKRIEEHQKLCQFINDRRQYLKSLKAHKRKFTEVLEQIEHFKPDQLPPRTPSSIYSALANINLTSILEDNFTFVTQRNNDHNFKPKNHHLYNKYEHLRLKVQNNAQPFSKHHHKNYQNKNTRILYTDHKWNQHY